MKKLSPIFLIICGCLFSPQLQAQAPVAASSGGNAFTQGTLAISPGVGYGYNYGYVGSFAPALSLSVDDGLKAQAGPGTIGIGGIVGLKFGSDDNVYLTYSNSYTEFIIAARGTYHWTPPGAPGLDLFGGIPIGVRFDHYSYWNTRITGHDIYGYPIYGYYQVTGTTPFLFGGLFVGASYYFSSKIGVFAELGYDVSIFTVGINIKLK